MKNALVIGSSGAIGSALVERLKKQYSVAEINQNNCDYTHASLDQWRHTLGAQGRFSIIICCVGVLHTSALRPEKKLTEIHAEKLLEYFRINAVLPALCMKYFHALLDSGAPSRFVFLSAMVGSIGDNRLGGWYGYRSSKAALNQLVKTASIELRRLNAMACLVAVHPGTTQSSLSKPYAARVQSKRYYTPEQSAERITRVIESLTPEQSGEFFNWDGSTIAW